MLNCFTGFRARGRLSDWVSATEKNTVILGLISRQE